VPDPFFILMQPGCQTPLLRGKIIMIPNDIKKFYKNYDKIIL